jgi:signal peptidase I
VLKVGGYSRGDVVVFRDTLDWLNETPRKPDALESTLVFLGLMPDNSVGYLIKRVIGTEGDRVVCCDAQGRLTVNGQPVDEQGYLYVDKSTGQMVDPSAQSFDVVVPKGTIWVMGDHRNGSADSRSHLGEPTGDRPEGSNAFVPVENVVGRAAAVVWPFNRFKILDHPGTFDTVPAPESIPDEPIINESVSGR